MKFENKYIMWVEEIDKEQEIVYAVGHKKDSENEIKFATEFDFDWLKIMFADDYDEFMQLGRLFYYTHTIEPGLETNRVELTNFNPLTEEQIADAEKRAEEWTKKLK
jgi:hypothetical protein